MARPSANVCSISTSSYLHPVSLMHEPIGTVSWDQPVPLLVNWHRFVPQRPLQALGASQEYQLLLQPVLMPRISTGCNCSGYFWCGSLARFLGDVISCSCQHMCRGHIELFPTHLAFQLTSIYTLRCMMSHIRRTFFCVQDFLRLVWC